MGDKKCLFFGKFSVLCFFLVTRVSRFELLPCYRRIDRFRAMNLIIYFRSHRKISFLLLSEFKEID